MLPQPSQSKVTSGRVATLLKVDTVDQSRQMTTISRDQQESKVSLRALNASVATVVHSARLVRQAPTSMTIHMLAASHVRTSQRMHTTTRLANPTLSAATSVLRDLTPQTLTQSVSVLSNFRSRDSVEFTPHLQCLVLSSPWSSQSGSSSLSTLEPSRSQSTVRRSLSTMVSSSLSQMTSQLTTLLSARETYT